MDHLDSLCQELQALWDQHFPLSAAMAMRVASFEHHQLTTHTALTPNTNIHKTAFAGSLYAIESLTAWGLLYLELKVAGFDASIIHAHGNIKFYRPIRDDIFAQADFSGHESLFESLRESGKGRLSLQTRVWGATEALTEPAASEFDGLYVVRLN